MLARIAHELRRLVKAHRLAVEDGSAEHVRIMAFDPRRSVDQKREARRVTFGKAVFAKTLDLVKAAFGKSAFITAAHHAVDEFVLKAMNGAVVTKGRHGSAETVGFIRSEFCCVDGDLHRLLLKQGYA